MMTEFFMPMKPPTKKHQEKQVSCLNGSVGDKVVFPNQGQAPGRRV